jgi:hypothetical protein
MIVSTSACISASSILVYNWRLVVWANWQLDLKKNQYTPTVCVYAIPHSLSCDNYAAIMLCTAQAEELLSWMATLAYTEVTHQLHQQLLQQHNHQQQQQQQRQQPRCQTLTSELCSLSKMAAAAAVLQRAELCYSSNCVCSAMYIHAMISDESYKALRKWHI